MDITPPIEILNSRYNKEQLQDAILHALRALIAIGDEDYGINLIPGSQNQQIGPIQANEYVQGIINRETVTLFYYVNQEEIEYKVKIFLQYPIILPDNDEKL